MSTTVHVVRHGEVHNPDGVLYGRMGGFSLSERGREMAQTVAAALAEHDIVRVWTSPLERARETAEPIAAGHGLEAEVDPRVTESANVFEGRRFSPGASPLRDPGTWADDVCHRADVTAAMARLSAREEEVLQLHLWEGLESREIAEVLGVPAAVVRPRLSRARARLRALLGNDPPPDGHLPNKRPASKTPDPAAEEARP